jgi:hypothetical protein
MNIMDVVVAKRAVWKVRSMITRGHEMAIAEHSDQGLTEADGRTVGLPVLPVVGLFNKRTVDRAKIIIDLEAKKKSTMNNNE